MEERGVRLAGVGGVGCWAGEVGEGGVWMAFFEAEDRVLKDVRMFDGGLLACCGGRKGF